MPSLSPASCLRKEDGSKTVLSRRILNGIMRKAVNMVTLSPPSPEGVCELVGEEEEEEGLVVRGLDADVVVAIVGTVGVVFPNVVKMFPLKKREHS